jgi:putative holliday junction resolvase
MTEQNTYIQSEQGKETDKGDPLGRIIGIDLGSRRVGMAISDELRLTVRPLPVLLRSNWKKLVREIRDICAEFDAKTVVLGLPLSLDGSEGTAAKTAKRIARNLHLSLGIPVVLHDERLTSFEAERRLKAEGVGGASLTERLDSEAAALILTDYISTIVNP